jgi:hypothetical protein
MDGYRQIVLASRRKGLPTPSHLLEGGSLSSPSDNQILTGRNLGKTLVRIAWCGADASFGQNQLPRSTES